ncbi:BQ5605_C010g06031 [Microbotryum silenes-dioicae]|uniref:BQ5605_C010g06031 protein n=1 Tax=Microbotryum silenes-dioicae TaxID=796604 RepID=A0A2X0NME7_9BASI|nr:BQ5605_C010g06031 [Microbotryum silenes-dioicae]
MLISEADSSSGSQPVAVDHPPPGWATCSGRQAQGREDNVPSSAAASCAFIAVLAFGPRGHSSTDSAVSRATFFPFAVTRDAVPQSPEPLFCRSALHFDTDLLWHVYVLRKPCFPAKSKCSTWNSLAYLIGYRIRCILYANLFAAVQALAERRACTSNGGRFHPAGSPGAHRRRFATSPYVMLSPSLGGPCGFDGGTAPRCARSIVWHSSRVFGPWTSSVTLDILGLPRADHLLEDAKAAVLSASTATATALSSSVTLGLEIRDSPAASIAGD